MTTPRKNGPSQKPITDDGRPIFLQATAGEAIDVSADDVEFTAAVSLFVGNTGDIVVDFANGTTEKGVAVAAFREVTLENIANGSFLPILVTKVYNSGTTASGIVALHSAEASRVSA